MVVGPPAETHAGGSHWHNFSLQSVSGGLKLDDMVFQIQTSGGAIVPAGADWKVEILGMTGTLIGNDTYSLQNESWYATASTPLASGETISLESAGTVLNGNNLDVLGEGPYQGAVSVEIPSFAAPIVCDRARPLTVAVAGDSGPERRRPSPPRQQPPGPPRGSTNAMSGATVECLRRR